MAVITALVGLTVFSIYQTMRAEEQAHNAAAQAEREKQMARIAFSAVETLTYTVPTKLQAIPGTRGVIKEIIDQNIHTLEELNAVVGTNQQATRNLASNTLKLVDLLLLGGDVSSARDALAKSGPLIQLLIETDPNNDNWRRDLSIHHQRMGNLLMAEGNFEDALREYRAGLEIVERLVAQDPGNRLYQLDLSINHEKIGDVLMTRGDAEGALREYRLDLEIAERLAGNEPGNAERQLDLAISHDRVAKALTGTGKEIEAARHERLAQQIREPLRQK